MSLHRPMKVERTRKRSEGFPLDRKVEKKKGEGLAVLLTAQALAARGCRGREGGRLHLSPQQCSGRFLTTSGVGA